MTSDDLKDQLREQWDNISTRIQESPLYNNLKEKYDTLPANGQRGIIMGVIAVATLAFISFPLSYLSSSSSYDAEYTSNRDLLRGLLRASRLASEASSLPPAVTAAEMKSQIQNVLSQEPFLPEQIAGVQDLDANSMGDFITDKNIRKEGLGLSLKKLNLNQVTNLGFRFQNLNPSMKMLGMEIQASSPDPHYFDVVYKFVVYGLSSGGPHETEGGE